MCGPAHWVVGIKIAHRHLEKGQLAMAGAKLKSYYAEKAKERMDKGRPKEGKENLPDLNAGQARDQAAAKVGVSGKSVGGSSPWPVRVASTKQRR